MSSCCPDSSATSQACCPAVPDGAMANDCCNFYAQDWVRELLADYFHPGGAALTDRTIHAMAMHAGERIADLGCGSGSSSLMLASEHRLQVIAIDLNQSNLDYAAARARHLGLNLVDDIQRLDSPDGQGGLCFMHADATRLPIADASLDGVLCECTLSLFPHQAETVKEIYRCLKPGGRLGVTDMAVAGSLAPELLSVIGPWACLNGALSASAYLDLFSQAGFSVQDSADESQSLIDLLEGLKRRLLVLAAGQSLGMVQHPNMPKLDMAQVKHYLERARDEIVAGRIRYLRFNMVKA